MNAWWVNQNQSYRQERTGGLLWAPLRTRDGRTQPHWETMLQAEPGDVILHYAGGAVRARSRVDAAAIEARRPVDLPDDLWASTGRLVRATYFDAAEAVRLDEIPLEGRLGHSRPGPFREDGAVKVGYLFPLDGDFVNMFEEAFGDRFDRIPPLLPAEAEDDARTLLRRLIGTKIHTPRGDENRIISVGGDTVLVATDRSPAGQPVPIALVEKALARLRADGSLVVEPSEIGYRSAFVAAVLLTLPGASVQGSPPVVTVDATRPDTATAEAYEGDLSRTQQTETRGEQAALRRRLFGSASVAQCAICGDTYPVRFLRAAHIKRRGVCTDEEKRDLGHIAMPACVFGCDALYELGFVSVDEAGRIVTARSAHITPALAEHLVRLEGRNCLAATDSSARYFDWHRSNVFIA